MLTPDELADVANTMYPLLDNLNAFITRDMVTRMMARLGRGEDAALGETDVWQANVYREAGGQYEALSAELTRFTELSEQEIARIFDAAGLQSWREDEAFFRERGYKTPREPSPRLRAILADAYQRTAGEARNFTRTTASVIEERFVRLLDEAHIRVMSGAAAYTTVVADMVSRLGNSQATVLYPSGHVDTIETAVLRAVRTGVAQASGNMTLENMREREWDLVRVSAHLGARTGDGGQNPGNHSWWQGKLYSLSGKDKSLPPFEETTGYGTGEGLCGWNCRHSFGPGDRKHNPFAKIGTEENKRAYELSQEQRAAERQIRAQKLELIALREGVESAKDPALKAKLQEKYDKAAYELKGSNTAYTEFCERHGLRPLPERTFVGAWSRADTRASLAAAKRAEKKEAESKKPGGGKPSRPRRGGEQTRLF